MSVDLTPAESALALQRLLVFKNGFMADAARAVCADDRLPSERVEAAVAALVAEGALVRADLPTRAVRYDWSAEYLGRGSNAQDLPAFELRKAEWFVTYLQELKPRLSEADQILWLDQIEADHEDLHASIEWALEGADANISLSLCVACFRYWYVRGHFKIGSELTLTAVNRVPMRQDMNKLRALNNAALMLEARGQLDRSSNALKSALGLAHALGNDSAVAAILVNLATNARDLMDYANAGKYHQEAIDILERVGDRNRLLPALINYAATKLDFQVTDGVEALLDEAEALARELDEEWGLAFVAENRGQLRELNNNYEEARHHYKDSLTRYSKIKDTKSVARLLNLLAELAVTASRFDRAATLFGAAEFARGTCHVGVPPLDENRAIVAMTSTRGALGEAAFLKAYGIGHTMRLDEAVRYATVNG
jgi:tetratricopeptide (TPR) repeat protein